MNPIGFQRFGLKTADFVYVPWNVSGPDLVPLVALAGQASPADAVFQEDQENQDGQGSGNRVKVQLLNVIHALLITTLEKLRGAAEAKGCLNKVSGEVFKHPAWSTHRRRELDPDLDKASYLLDHCQNRISWGWKMEYN